MCYFRVASLWWSMWAWNSLLGNKYRIVEVCITRVSINHLTVSVTSFCVLEWLGFKGLILDNSSKKDCFSREMDNSPGKIDSRIRSKYFTSVLQTDYTVFQLLNFFNVVLPDHWRTLHRLAAYEQTEQRFWPFRSFSLKVKCLWKRVIFRILQQKVRCH